MLRYIYENFIRNRWFVVGPVVVFAAYNVYLAAVPLGSEMPRTPAIVEASFELDEVELDQERQRKAQKLESRPLIVQFGDDVAESVRIRVEDHLQEASTEPVEVIDAGVAVEEFDGRDVLAIGFGDTEITRALIERSELETVGDEGYVLRSGSVGEANPAIAVDAEGMARNEVSNVGTNYGVYALLEELGFGFLHPLEPTPPLAIAGEPPTVDRSTSPRWPVRGLQLHTMHPLELTELLQGWGPEGPDDKAGWEAMLDEWDVFLEWMVANGQNQVHWVWLAAHSWMDFADSDERIERIARVVKRAHGFGIDVGVHLPLRLQQQNAGRLIRSEGSLEDEIRQIEEGVAHMMEAGFNYLATKPGTTEFTAVEDKRMLEWMNALAITADEDHDAPVYIKVHASTGQYADDFEDPTTGEAINFNFLPHYADSRLGVMPHTVQHYSLSDPAPTYGNEDFSEIRRFLNEQAGSRPTVWHPETSYWVSFDNDVPLFLPVYASRRVHDLRLLAGDEDAGRMGRGEHAGATMDGQLTFSSGWEWGYWIQEVVTARAAWDPHTEYDTDEQALEALLKPVERVFGEAGEELVQWLVDYTRVQQDLLIEGRVDGAIPDDVVRRNGQAYLQGWETWDDISHSLADLLGVEHGRMQPERVGLVEMRSRSFERAEYSDFVAPLLMEMKVRFEKLTQRLKEMGDDIPANALALYAEIRDAAKMTELRARQIRGLYAYVDAEENGPSYEGAKQYLASARDALDEAISISAQRERHYRVPAERIAAWRDNPTVYPFTYLWTVRSLFYWQRDETQAVTGARNPCLYNIIDPINVVHDDDWVSHWTDRAGGAIGWLPALSGVAQCMRAPAEEPAFLPVDWRGPHYVDAADIVERSTLNAERAVTEHEAAER